MRWKENGMDNKWESHFLMENYMKRFVLNHLDLFTFSWQTKHENIFSSKVSFHPKFFSLTKWCLMVQNFGSALFTLQLTCIVMNPQQLGLIFCMCANRSQHQNKAAAMAVLQSRLDQLELVREAQMNAQHTQSLTEIGWGNQIRTYVIHPYRMVKDLRTNYEVTDPDAVLEGDIDGFIMSYLSASLDKDTNE
ncbi:hypothetical protein QQ045_005479 [Rhodiola kirilowii]